MAGAYLPDLTADSPFLPRTVRAAATRFHRKRSAYYVYLEHLLKGAGGEIKILNIFERDAERYGGQPRGVLSAHWAQSYMENGGNLANAMAGTLPDDEVTIFRVAQEVGPDALLAALKDVARIAELGDGIRRATIATLAAGVIGVLVAVLMMTVYPIFSAAKLEEIFAMVPVVMWGPKATALRNHAARVVAFGPLVLAVAIVCATWVYWSIGNLTGPLRERLDSGNFLYRTVRDIKGALFLATMAILTKRHVNVLDTLTDSLAILSAGARTKWLRWRVNQISSNADRNGAVGAECFDTNFLSRDMYFFLRDMQEARGVSDGFAEAGRYVEGTVVKAISTRLMIYRWVLLIIGLLCVVIVPAWQMASIYEMKEAMQNYYSSR